MRIVRAEVFLDEEKRPQLKTCPAKLYKLVLCQEKVQIKSGRFSL